MMLEFVDATMAPEVFATGLDRVEIMGSVSRFVLYIERTVCDQSGQTRTTRECAVAVIMPNEAIGPGIDMTVRTLGAKIIVPALHYATRQLLM